MKHCANCGKEHNNGENYYCKTCSERFARWGMTSFILVEDHIMTHDEILKMPAGREMDALIVEKVMGGFTASPDDWSEESRIWFFRHKRDGALIGTPYLTSGEPSVMYSHSWKKFQPSTDIADAWLLIEKLTDSLIPIDCGLRTSVRGWTVTIEAKYEDHKANAETAPLAICRAALLTKLDEKH